MAKTFTGRDGRLLLNDDVLAKVQNWSLSAEVEMLETTTLGDDARTYVPGVKSCTGSCSLLYYEDDDGANDAALLLRNIIRTGGVPENSNISLVLRFFDGVNNEDIRVNCFINSAQLGAAVGEVSTAQISFTGSGDLTGVTI
jgi:hypothetical protein